MQAGGFIYTGHAIKQTKGHVPKSYLGGIQLLPTCFVLVNLGQYSLSENQFDFGLFLLKSCFHEIKFSFISYTYLRNFYLRTSLCLVTRKICASIAQASISGVSLPVLEPNIRSDWFSLLYWLIKLIFCNWVPV